MEKDSARVIWCSREMSEEDQEKFKEAVRGYEVVFCRDLPLEPALDWSKVEIVFGQPSPQTLQRLDGLGWIHLDSAGYARYDHPDFQNFLKRRQLPMTNSSEVFAEPCAQHLLAMILALARRLPAALESQRTERSWPQAALRSSSYLLQEQTVLILGLGRIARRLIQLLNPFDLNLMAIRRRVRGGEPVPTSGIEDLDTLLSQSDHIVNILPENRQSRHVLDGTRFEKMKKGAVLYNIGRGTTVDQTALAGALRSGNLQAAYLDVTDPEPLPPDDPLWRLPNCFITPHTAGGHARERQRLTRHFFTNLERYTRGESLLDRVF